MMLNNTQSIVYWFSLLILYAEDCSLDLRRQILFINSSDHVLKLLSLRRGALRISRWFIVAWSSILIYFLFLLRFVAIFPAYSCELVSHILLLISPDLLLNYFASLLFLNRHPRTRAGKQRRSHTRIHEMGSTPLGRWNSYIVCLHRLTLLHLARRAPYRLIILILLGLFHLALLIYVFKHLILKTYN